MVARTGSDPMDAVTMVDCPHPACNTRAPEDVANEEWAVNHYNGKLYCQECAEGMTPP